MIIYSYIHRSTTTCMVGHSERDI